MSCGHGDRRFDGGLNGGFCETCANELESAERIAVGVFFALLALALAGLWVWLS